MINVMQVGYGYWGTNVAKKLACSSMFQLKYVIEQDAGRRNKAKEDLPKETLVAKEYADDFFDQIDGVVICTQTEYSYQIAMEAMAHGKHVFTEKPIATNVERTMNLIAEAEKGKLILHCDHLMVYNPVISYIKDMIDSGEVGDVMYIDISRVNLGPIRRDINAMLDLAVHDIAVVDYLLDGLEPKQLSAHGAGYYGNQETITYLTMKNKEVLININSSWISPRKVRKMVIAGTKKMLVFDDMKMEKLYVYNSGIDVVQGDTYGEYEYHTRTGDIYIPNIEYKDSLRNSLEHFGACILSGKKSLSGPEQCLRVMKILERAQNALKDTEA